MLGFFYTKKHVENLQTNYLAQFIEEAAKNFHEKSYTVPYTKMMLHGMSIFGDWLKTKNIPLDHVAQNHVEEFISHLFPQQANACIVCQKGKLIEKRKMAARLAVSMIRRIYHPSPRSLQLELFYTKKHVENLKTNYLAPFIEETAKDFHEKGYNAHYTAGVLRGMSIFGDWLKTKNIPLDHVAQNHVEEFISHLFPQQANACIVFQKGKLIEKRKMAARLAVSMIRRIYHPSPRSFQLELFYTEKHAENLKTNYLAPFMEETAKDLHENGYSAPYAKVILHGMSLFGDWLKMKGISLENVLQSHVEEFDSDLLARQH